MQNPGYIALSRQIALTRQMDVTANNIANIDAAGFKRQGILFKEHLSEVESGAPVSYVEEVGTVRDLAQGPLRVTGRDLDLAIDGDGYFTVETPGGVRYGRGGQFQLNADGEIVNRNGHALLNDEGERIQLPEGASKITVTKAGAILADGAEVAKIEAKRFENPQSLVHTADGLYRSDFPAEADPESVIMQGALEGSNVNPVSELVYMLEIQRDYQASHKMMKGEHDRLTRAIRELGKVEQA